MRISTAILLVFSLVGTPLLTNAAFCADKSQKVSGKKIVPSQRPNIMSGLTNTSVALTTGECKDLGGTVTEFDVCNSGKACSRRDENGKAHNVCISKAN